MGAGASVAAYINRNVPVIVDDLISTAESSAESTSTSETSEIPPDHWIWVDPYQISDYASLQQFKNN